MSIVLDASVVIHWCLPHGSEADTQYGSTVLKMLDSRVAIVPAIWSLEVANALTRLEKRGLINEALSGTFAAFLGSLDITPEPVDIKRDLSDTLHLARRFTLSAYDAAYLDLAIRTGLPLATLDNALRAAAQQAGAELVA